MKTPILIYDDIQHKEFESLYDMQHYLKSEGLITIISMNSIRVGKDIEEWEVFYIYGSYVENCE